MLYSLGEILLCACINYMMLMMIATVLRHITITCFNNYIAKFAMTCHLYDATCIKHTHRFIIILLPVYGEHFR